MIAMVTATYLQNGCYHIEEIQKVSTRLQLHWIGLQDQVNKETYSRTSASSQLHVYSSPGVAWLYVPRLE